MDTHTIHQWMEARGQSTVEEVKTKFEYTEFEKAIAQSFSEAIHEGKITAKSILQDLDAYFKNDDDLIGVSRALALLLAIFERTQKISEHDLHIITDFLVTRIKNENNSPAQNAGLQETILLFKTLSGLYSFPPQDTALIVQGIFSLADNRTRFKDIPDLVRQDVYTVVDYFFRRYSQILIKYLGYNKLVNGLLDQNWDLSTTDLESLFTSFIRYFPIKVGGGGSDLKNEALRQRKEMSHSLKECIVSNKFYASLAFPHFIQRIDDQSTLSATSMHDILLTIDECVKIYPTETIKQWSTKLWDALKFGIWNGENEDHIKDSLQILRSITISLDFKEVSRQDQGALALRHYIIGITTECRERIVDSPKKYLLSTGRILYAIASSSSHAFNLVTKTILSPLLVLWREMKLGSEKKMLLRVVTYILKALVELLGDKDVPLNQDAIEMIQTLSSFQDGLVETLSNAVVELKWITVDSSRVEENLTNDTLCFVPALESLALLFRIPSFLTGVEQGMIVQELVQIITKSPRDCDAHKEGLLALQKISVFRPAVFAEMILPSLFDELPGTIFIDRKKQITDLQEISRKLNDLADVSCHPCSKELYNGPVEDDTSYYWHKNFNSFVNLLLKKVEALFLVKGQIPYAKALIATLYKGLKLYDDELDSTHLVKIAPDSRASLYEPLWIEIVNKTLRLTPYPRDHPLFKTNKRFVTVRKLPSESDKLDDIFLHLTGKILLLIARSKMTTSENNIVFKFYNGSLLLGEAENLQCEGNLVCFQQICEPEFINDPSVSLVSIHLLVGVKPVSDDDIFLTKTKSCLGINEDAGNLAVSTIIKIMDTENILSSRVRISMLWYVQILVAKFYCSRDKLKSGGNLLNFINSLVESSRNQISHYIELLYQMIAYVTTASFACYDRNMMEPLFKLLGDALDPENHDAKISSLVAQSFRMVLAESHILNEKNFVKLRSLRKGFVLELLKPLIVKYHVYSELVAQNFKNHRRSMDNYLIAIIGILRNLDAPLILDRVDLKDLVSLALDGTNVSNDNWAKAEYIKLVRMLVREKPDYMVMHIDNTIERMIERTHNTLEMPSDANVECRILALEVLRLMVEKFGPLLLLKRRINLMAELAVAKDDCHAGVRQAAAQCSLALIYVNS